MMRLALAAVLLLTPLTALAQDVAVDEEEELPACTAWSAQMQEDEGGEVFTAQVCAKDRPDAYLLMTCSAGAIFMRYDLAAGAERSPGTGETAGVDFTIGVSTQRVDMQYEEMDGMFAAQVPAAGPLVALMASGEALRISDGAGLFPEHSFRLAGSSSAIKALLAHCS